VELPFTPDQFFEVFAEYNRAFWFVVLVWWLGSVAVLAAAWWNPVGASRALTLFLGALWAWNAVVYHAWLFTRINPAAWLFALLFAAQAALLFLAARTPVAFFSDTGPTRMVGIALISYALVYPFLTLALGHTYPATPTFGVPCPTDLLTIGALLTVRGGVRVKLAIIPVIWGFVGGSAALLLNVRTDYVLLAAGVALVVALMTQRSHGVSVAGGISEKTYVNINGVRQGMFIKGQDPGNPVLLYLHGGMPEYFLNERYPTGLDEYFTVVWWEQRGSGLSYSADIRPETITPSQLVSDTIVLTNYLRERFGQRQIYLMGHSGGTFIGVQVAAQAPELYRAYVAVAQMSDQLKSERFAYEYMLRRFNEDGHPRMVRKLEAAPVGDTIPLPAGYMSVRDVAMHRLGIGTTHDIRSVVTLLLLSFACREYTWREKINLWRGKIASGKQLWNAQLATDLTKQASRLNLPVYFLHGLHDYTVSYAEAKAYYQLLDAPMKGFYTFEHSAHSPMFEEPGRMREIMKHDVLQGAHGHADSL
jgi:pimeloyl-ACP methyl ester carboxylesterase